MVDSKDIRQATLPKASLEMLEQELRAIAKADLLGKPTKASVDKLKAIIISGMAMNKHDARKGFTGEEAYVVIERVEQVYKADQRKLSERMSGQLMRDALHQTPPMKLLDELFVELTGSDIFSHIDAARARRSERREAKEAAKPDVHGPTVAYQKLSDDEKVKDLMMNTTPVALRRDQDKQK